MLGQRSINTANTFKTQLFALNEDSSKLASRMQQLSEEYEHSYQTHLEEASRLSKSSSSASRIYINTQLNKLLFKNSEKLKQIEDLRKEVHALANASSRIQYEKKIDLENSLACALQSVNHAKNEQESINTLLGREKVAILKVKEKLLRLEDDHKKLTKSYSDSKVTREKAAYNLIIAKNEEIKSIKEKTKNNKMFEERVKEQEKLKIECQKEKKRIIEEASKKFVELEVNAEKNRRSKEELQQTLRLIDNFEVKKKMDLRHLNDYRQQISVINKIIKKFGMETVNPPKTCNPQTSSKLKKSVKCIIQAYRYLKYKEESLSMQFSILTSENSMKIQELAHYSKRITKLKNSNIPIQQLEQNLLKENDSIRDSHQPSQMTFNLKTEEMEGFHLFSARSEAIQQKTEEGILKFFFEILLILEKSLKKLENDPKTEEKDFFKYVKTQIGILDSLKSEIFSYSEPSPANRASIKGIDSKILIQNFNGYKPIALLKHQMGLIANKDFDDFYIYFKSHQILQFFISIDQLALHFKASAGTKNLYLNVSSSAHSSCRLFCTKILEMLKDLLKKTQNDVVTAEKAGSKLFSQDSIKIKDNARVFKRNSTRYPYIKSSGKCKNEVVEDSEEDKKSEDDLPKQKSSKENLKQRKGELELLASVPKQVLKIEKQIKDLKFKERVAGNRENLEKVLPKMGYSQLWAVRTPKTQTIEKGDFKFQFLTPKNLKFELKV